MTWEALGPPLCSGGFSPADLAHRVWLGTLEQRLVPPWGCFNPLLQTLHTGTFLVVQRLRTGLVWASWWLSGRESACQCRKHRFDPWFQEDLTYQGAAETCAPQLLSLCSRAQGLKLLKPEYL